MVLPHTPLIPAKAGIQSYKFQVIFLRPLGPRFRGDERDNKS
jgi:hypothetical protein